MLSERGSGEAGVGRHLPTVTTVVWDLGNVLIPWDRSRALEAAFGDRTEARLLAETIFTMDLNDIVDAGSNRDEILATVDEIRPGAVPIVAAYLDYFNHSLGPVITGSAQLLEDLSARGVRCVGLSNFSRVTFGGVPDRYPVLGLLEGILISGDVGFTKPDPRIYRLCEHRFDFGPGEVLFVDDNEANVDAALVLGWDAVRFTDPEALRSILTERGLLPGLR